VIGLDFGSATAYCSDVLAGGAIENDKARAPRARPVDANTRIGFRGKADLDFEYVTGGHSKSDA